MNEIADAYECLKKYRYALTKQEYTLFKGQIRSGQVIGAMNGLAKVLEKNNYARRAKHYGEKNYNRNTRSNRV